jgi:hypothetical protein
LWPRTWYCWRSACHLLGVQLFMTDGQRDAVNMHIHSYPYRSQLTCRPLQKGGNDVTLNLRGPMRAFSRYCATNGNFCFNKSLTTQFNDKTLKHVSFTFIGKLSGVTNPCHGLLSGGMLNVKCWKHGNSSNFARCFSAS